MKSAFGGLVQGCSTLSKKYWCILQGTIRDLLLKRHIRAYCFGGKEITSRKAHGGEDEHEPKVETPIEVGILDDETADYWADD